MQINDNIKLIRELSGLTQAKFAELIKTNVSNLKTYENTSVRPKAFIIFNVSALAGISSDELENKKLIPEEIKINQTWLKKGEIDESNDNVKSPSADYLAGQLAMAERLIAKLEENNEEAKADKNKLFEALTETRQTINDLLKPMVASLKDIPPVLDTIVRNSNEHDKEIMKALDRLVGNQPGTLEKESGKRILKGALEQQKKGKAGVDKTGK
jgi:transcriptional regulator with XRE-family HTH domain